MRARTSWIQKKVKGKFRSRTGRDSAEMEIKTYLNSFFNLAARLE
jgi:hypothetical protein